MIKIDSEDFREWMDEDPDVTDQQRDRLGVLIAGSMHVRLLLVSLFNHNVGWDGMAEATLHTQPNKQNPVEQAATICLRIFDSNISAIGESLEELQDAGYGDFVRDILRKLSKSQRDELVEYVSLR